MAQDSSEIVVGANGSVYTAPYADDLTLPDDIDTPVDSDFSEHGFVSEDGLAFTDGKEINDIGAWQSFYPVRKVVTSKNSSIEFALRQFNPDNVELAFGGGNIEEAGGVAVYTPPLPDEIDNRAAVLEWFDDEFGFRLVLPKGIVTGDVATNINRTDATDLPISLEVTPEGRPTMGQPETFPWYLVTDHPAYNVSSS